MLENISIGQYIPGKSWIYKMDPRMKIILTFLLMAVIFILPTLLSISIALGIFVLILLTTGIPIIKVLKGLKPVIYLLLFTFVLQILFTKTGDLKANMLFSFNFYNLLIILGIFLVYIFTKKYIPFKMIYFLLFIVSVFLVQYYVNIDKLFNLEYHVLIYEGGLNKGLFIAIRIILMISLTSLLTFTTTNMDINNGISFVLKPLKVIKIPVDTISMMMSLTLRFIPTLLYETKKIMNAQASRGIDFQEGGLKDKVTQIVSLLIPMFVISIRKAEDLSNAMVARGYEIGAPRTQYDLLKLKVIDYLTLIIVLLLLGFSIWLRVNA